MKTCDKPSKPRSSTKIVSTEHLSNALGKGASIHRKCPGKRRQGVYTKRLGNRLIGLGSRRGIFHYRRLVPTGLLMVLNQREIRRSLDTDSYAMALRRIHRIAAKVEAEFEKARGSIGRAIDPALLAVTSGEATAAKAMMATWHRIPSMTHCYSSLIGLDAPAVVRWGGRALPAPSLPGRSS